MKTLDFIKLDKQGAENVANCLQVLLADLQVYYTNLHSFHWNIQGMSFFSLHEQFQKMYNDTADKVDEVAERILTLGGVPENRFSSYLKVARIAEVGAVSDAEEIIKNILNTLGHLIAEERKILAMAADINDEGTVALMSEYISGQEPYIWIFTALLKK